MPNNSYKLNEEEVKESILFKELTIKNHSLKEEIKRLSEVFLKNLLSFYCFRSKKKKMMKSPF